MKFLISSCILFFWLPLCSQTLSTKFFFVKTVGKLPFLEYGLGDDRLGGAKMSYLDSNVLLKVIDSSGRDYKVQLSRQHTAFIAKDNVVRADSISPKPYYLTGNWKIYGDSSYDYVMMTMDEKLPYRSQQQINPSRIVVDIYGATSNTNWITQLKSNKEISNVYYEQTEDDVFRAIVELRHAQHWGHALYYDSTGRRLVLRVKRQPALLNLKSLRIAIDAGHGGDNPGAAGISKKGLEKDYSLQIAKQLAATLKAAGAKHLFLTRTKDTSLSMPERIDMLKTYDPHLLISIHLNSSSVDTVQGTSTYYRYIGFRSLSVSVLNQLLTLKLKEFGNVGSFNFALSGPTEFVNCLAEIAFLSNLQDEKKIIDPKFQKAVAGKIYLGILDWIKTIK